MFLGDWIDLADYTEPGNTLSPRWSELFRLGVIQNSTCGSGLDNDRPVPVMSMNLLKLWANTDGIKADKAETRDSRLEEYKKKIAEAERNGNMAYKKILEDKKNKLVKSNLKIVDEHRKGNKRDGRHRDWQFQ